MDTRSWINGHRGQDGISRDIIGGIRIFSYNYRLEGLYFIGIGFIESHNSSTESKQVS